MNSLEQKIKQNAIKFGILLGVILLSLAIISFYTITQLTSAALWFIIAPILFSFIIPIASVVLICVTMRKRIGGYWSMRQATTGIFIMFIIAYAIQTGGRDLIFAKLVEPHMVKKTEDAFLKANTFIKTKGGANPKQIAESEVEIRKEFEDQKHVSVGGVIQGVFISIILVFVLALIFGALFKREHPGYVTATVIEPGQE
jgi:hypothetical protein